MPRKRELIDKPKKIRAAVPQSLKDSPIWIPPPPDVNLRLSKAADEWVAHKTMFVGQGLWGTIATTPKHC